MVLLIGTFGYSRALSRVDGNHIVVSLSSNLFLKGLKLLYILLLLWCVIDA